MSTLTNRRYFGKEEKNLPELDLISVQKDSWKLFIDEAIAQELAEISPIDDFLGDIPQMTSRGTFVINGIERCVINQLVRSPGIYFSGDLDASSGRMLYGSEVRPLHGSWLEFEISRNDVIAARIDRRGKR